MGSRTQSYNKRANNSNAFWLTLEEREAMRGGEVLEASQSFEGYTGLGSAKKTVETDVPGRAARVVKLCKVSWGLST